MNSIKINVTETDVTITELPEKITAENINCIKCEFSLSSAFDNLIVRASFNGEYRTVEQGECFAPPLKEGTCRIGVYGYTLDDNGEYQLRISPEPTKFYVNDGSYSEKDIEASSPPPSELETYYSRMKKLFKTDTKLSVESSNAIANSTVANILGKGHLKGIYTFNSYEEMESAEWMGDQLNSLDDEDYLIIIYAKEIYDNEGELVAYPCIAVMTKNGGGVVAAAYDNEIRNLTLLFERLQSQTEQRFLTIQNLMSGLSGVVDNLIEGFSNGHLKGIIAVRNYSDIEKADEWMMENLEKNTDDYAVVIYENNIYNSDGTLATYPGIAVMRKDSEDIIVGKVAARNYDKQIDQLQTQLESAKDISVITTEENAITINPNVLYSFGETAALDITLGAGKADVVNEYMFEFTSGETPTTLTVPASVKWAGDITIEANKRYQVSILNNIGIMAGVDI